MKEALVAVIDHFFDKGCHRFDAEVYSFNAKSIALLNTLGFRNEGTRREGHFDGERYWDVFMFGLVKGIDWD